MTQVKCNQKQLKDDCETVVANEKPLDSYEAPAEKEHGRIETRECRVYSFDFSTDPEWQPLIKCVVEIKRSRSTPEPKSKGGGWKKTEETAIFVCTKMLTAQEAEEAVRGHWGTENKNHHVRDVSLLEDASRIRKNPGSMARLRSFALNVLRANEVPDVAASLYKNTLNFNNIKKLNYLWN